MYDAARAPRRRSFCDDEWRGIPTALLEIPARAESGPKYADTSTVLIATSGRGRRWYRRAGTDRMLSTCPSMVELYETGYEIEHARWEGVSGECIALRFPSATIGALLHEEAADLRIGTRHEVFDEQLVSLGTALLRRPGWARPAPARCTWKACRSRCWASFASAMAAAAPHRRRLRQACRPRSGPG